MAIWARPSGLARPTRQKEQVRLGFSTCNLFRPSQERVTPHWGGLDATRFVFLYIFYLCFFIFLGGLGMSTRHFYNTFSIFCALFLNGRPTRQPGVGVGQADILQLTFFWLANQPRPVSLCHPYIYYYIMNLFCVW